MSESLTVPRHEKARCVLEYNTMMQISGFVREEKHVWILLYNKNFYTTFTVT